VSSPNWGGLYPFGWCKNIAGNYASQYSLCIGSELCITEGCGGMGSIIADWFVRQKKPIRGFESEGGGAIIDGYRSRG